MQAQHLNNIEIIDEAGTRYSLWGGSPAHFVLMDGAGMAPVRRISQGSPLQHGVTDRGFRLQPRVMTLVLQTEGQNELQADSMREKLAYIFGPTNNQLALCCTRLDGTKRQIDVVVDGTLDFPMSKRLGAGQEITVPLLAQDPTWYDPTQQVNTVAMPTSALVNVSPSAVGTTWEDWPVMTIVGPATGLTIQHFYSGDNLIFSTPIPAGETFIIDTRPGQKRIYRSSDGARRDSYVTPATLTNLGTLRMFSEKWLKILNAAATTNTITAQATGTTGATSFSVSWYKRFICL